MDLQSKGSSIRQRLMLSFMLTTGVALLLASAAYFSIELYQLRSNMVENISLLARLIGANTTASMLFDDVADAEKTLATLEEHPRIMAAALYGKRGRAFARYLREGEKADSLPERAGSGHAFRRGALDLYEPLTAEGEILGTIYVRSDTTALSRLTQSFVAIFLLATAASLAVCYLGASLLRRRIAAPVEELLQGSVAMAAGDLSKRVVARTDDELGSLADSFNAMVSSLAGLVGKVRANTDAVANVSVSLQETSDTMCADVKRQEVAVDETGSSIESIHASIQQVNESVDTLSKTAEETSAASTEMDASIGEIASHMDGLSETIEITTSSVVEMTTAIREIAGSADELNDSTDSTVAALGLLRDGLRDVEGNASETRSLSERTASQADEGRCRVEKTMRSMQDIQQSFQGLEGIIDELATKSGSIGEVVKVIESVVEQTNLLALNAAIISAQAGEHGRAFAVVADEVNSLAERTAGSTREISQLIQSVQKTVSNAVEATAEGNAHIEVGVTLSQQASEILRVIGESAKESSERVHQIVNATEVQAQGIERVDGSVARVKSIAAQLDRGTHEQDSASSEIRAAMERMHDLAQRVTRSTQEQRQESSLISRSVEVVAERIKQILDATGEQRHQSDQIMQALQIFRESTHEGLRRSEEMASNVQELAEHSKALETEVGRFLI